MVNYSFLIKLILSKLIFKVKERYFFFKNSSFSAFCGESHLRFVSYKLLLDAQQSAHPPLHSAGANANINSTQSADANVNAEVSSAASADANIKFLRIIRECGCEYSLHLEGGLRQQRNDGGGCATMRERSERVESQLHM